MAMDEAKGPGRGIGQLGAACDAPRVPGAATEVCLREASLVASTATTAETGRTGAHRCRQNQELLGTDAQIT